MSTGLNDRLLQNTERERRKLCLHSAQLMFQLIVKGMFKT